MKYCIRCLISGRVQGVFFRAFTQREAERLGLEGWVRNLHDGRVEVMACGEEGGLRALQKWLKHGSPQAEVEEVEFERLAYQSLGVFRVR